MTITSPEDQALVAAHQAGDPEAFAEIVAAYRGSLLSHAQRRLHDPDAARDAVQETLLRAYRSIDNFGGERLLGPWLHRIVDNVCNDEASRRQREQLLLQRVGVPNAMHVDEGDIVDVSVSRALSSMPSNYRETLVLRAVDDLSFRELAMRTGITEENARARFHRARRMFRSFYDGSAAMLMPIAAFISRPWSRLRGGSNAISNQAAAASPALSPQVSSVVSSPTAMHFVTELGAAPDRASTLVKVVVTIATAVPVLAVASPSHGPATPQTPQVVQTSEAPADAAAADEETTEAGEQNVIVPPTSVPVVVTIPAVATVVPDLRAPERRAPATSDAADAATDSDDPADPDSEGAPVAGGDGEAAPPAHAPNAAHLVTAMDVAHMRDSIVYHASDLSFTVSGRTITGDLGCVVSSDASGAMSGPKTPADVVQCWFSAEDGTLDIKFDGTRVPSETADGRQLESYRGTWKTDSNDPAPMPNSGEGALDLDVGADNALADLWLDPPPDAP